MNNVIVFDFDGVLCDSIEECMIVSYNAYWNNEPIETENIDSLQSNYFHKYRSLVRPAGEYFILWESYYKNRDFRATSYGDMVEAYSSEISLFQEKFFNYREELKKDINFWISLHRPYPNTLTYLHKQNAYIYILTNKDRDSVEKISSAHGYRKKITEILSKDISSYKYVLFNSLIANHQKINRSSHYYFIDDHIENLRDVSRVDYQYVSCILAKWGYSVDALNDQFQEIGDIVELNDIIDSNYQR